jgi:hypothetical protein
VNAFRPITLQDAIMKTLGHGRHSTQEGTSETLYSTEGSGDEASPEDMDREG